MRYPKLYFFNGSTSQRVRVNRLSNYFLNKAINEGVWIEGELTGTRHKPPQKVLDAMIKVQEKRNDQQS